MKRLLLPGVFALAVHVWLLCGHQTCHRPEISPRAPVRTVRLALLPPAPAPAANAPRHREEASLPLVATVAPKPAVQKQRTQLPPALKPKSRPAAPSAKPAPPPAKKAPAPNLAGPSKAQPLPAVTDDVHSAPPSAPEKAPKTGSTDAPRPEPSKARQPASLPTPSETEGAAAVSQKLLIKARPLYQDNPPPTYPRLARRRGQQGTVMLAVLVNREGRVDELKLLTSSGFSLLDRAAAETVKGWRFEAGRSGEKPVDMWVTVPVRFALR